MPSKEHPFMEMVSKLKTMSVQSKDSLSLVSGIFSVVREIGRIKPPADASIKKFYTRKQSPVILALYNRVKNKAINEIVNSGFAQYLLLPMMLSPGMLKDIMETMSVYSDLYIRLSDDIVRFIGILDISKATILKSNIKQFCSYLDGLKVVPEEEKDKIRKSNIEKDTDVEMDVKNKLLDIVKKREDIREEKKKKKEEALNKRLPVSAKERMNQIGFADRDLEYVGKFRSDREKKAKLGADGLIELVKLFNKLNIRSRKEFYINSQKLDRMGAMRLIGYEEPPTGPTGKKMSIKDALKISFSSEPDKKDLICFKYQDGFFYGMITDPKNGGWSPAMRVARGLIIDRKKLKVVVSPQSKFFNSSATADEHIESPESMIDNLPQDEAFETVEKVDGVQIMISAYNGKLLFNTNGSIDSPYCKKAEQILNKRYGNKKAALIKWLEDTESTLCFELIDPTAKIVVDYSKGGSRHWVYPDGKVGDKVWPDGVFPSELILHSWIQRK